MLYDRDYMREGYPPQERSAIASILMTLLAVYVLQSVFKWWFGLEFLERAFGLRGSLVRHGGFWSLFTYCLLHDTRTPFHFLFNALTIYMFGRTVQNDIGSRKFIMLFMGSVFGGALMWLMFNFNSSAPLIGASAGALGILSLYCLLHPDQPVTFLLFFVLPVTIKPKYFGWAILGVELFYFLFYEVPPGVSTNIAHSAHLGGMLGGWLFFRHVLGRGSILKGAHPKVVLPQWLKKRRPGAKSYGNFHLNISNRRNVKEEVDRILDKINAQGFGSLSEEEKRILDSAKDLLNR